MISSDTLYNDNEDLYLFGYGSLLWNVGFEYEQSLFGYAINHRREFWLMSDDHRGTPEKMGRVVTLISQKNGSTDNDMRVYGMTYKIKQENVAKIFEYLNYREKCGYSLHKILFYPLEGTSGETKPLTCVTYYASEESPYFSTENDIDAVAKIIASSSGESGHNRDYLFRLCDTLRHLADKHKCASMLKYDEHLFKLEEEVKQLVSLLDKKVHPR